jgi:hypothetical protein
MGVLVAQRVPHDSPNGLMGRVALACRGGSLPHTSTQVVSSPANVAVAPPALSHARDPLVRSAGAALVTCVALVEHVIGGLEKGRLGEPTEAAMAGVNASMEVPVEWLVSHRRSSIHRSCCGDAY